MIARSVVLLFLVLVPRLGPAATPAPDDPRYENRRLSAWVLALPDYFECDPTNCRPFLALGSNAVPYLAWVVSRTNLDLADVGSVLRVMHARRTTEPTAELLQSVQARAAFVLEQLGPAARSATPALLVALRHGSGNQRLAAALALASVSPSHPKSVEMLDAVLVGDPGSGPPPDRSADPDSEVVLAVARLAIAPRAGPWERAIAAVGLCLLSEDRDRAAQVMASRWTHQERGFRMNALLPLTRVLRGQALPVLRVAGEDPDASVRRNAAVLASTLYPELPAEATELLVRAGHDEDRAVRFAALQHLWRIQPNSDVAVDAARRGLNDADETVRAAAAVWLAPRSSPGRRP